jgi:tripartite-type tricarboxylate transporter receptor subunit TctC
MFKSRGQDPGRFAIALASVLFLSLVYAPAQAAWPEKAIQYVVVFSPGGGSDVFARTVTPFLSRELGVPVNVINKPGGNQIPAINYVRNARPDGYTLIQEQQAASALKIMLDIPNADKIIRDRTFGPMLGGGASAIVVKGDSPWKTLKDMVNAAKKDPGKFTVWRTGGSFSDMIHGRFFEFVGVDPSKIKWVDYKGAGPGNIAVAGGHVMMGGGGANSVVTMHRSGDLKALAVTSNTRLSALPNVPTMAEAGYPGFDLFSWYGISGPTGLPPEVMQRLDGVVAKLTKDPEFVKALDKLGTFPFHKTPAEAKALVLKETEFYRKMAEEKKKKK